MFNPTDDLKQDTAADFIIERELMRSQKKQQQMAAASDMYVDGEPNSFLEEKSTTILSVEEALAICNKKLASA